MSGAAALRLDKDFGRSDGAARFGGDILAPGTDDDGDRIGAGGRNRGQHMAEHRTAGDGVQHLRHIRFHARAFAGGEDDGQTAARGLISGHCIGPKMTGKR